MATLLAAIAIAAAGVVGLLALAQSRDDASLRRPPQTEPTPTALP